MIRRAARRAVAGSRLRWRRPYNCDWVLEVHFLGRWRGTFYVAVGGCRGQTGWCVSDYVVERSVLPKVRGVHRLLRDAKTQAEDLATVEVPVAPERVLEAMAAAYWEAARCGRRRPGDHTWGETHEAERAETAERVGVLLVDPFDDRLGELSVADDAALAVARALGCDVPWEIG